MPGSLSEGRAELAFEPRWPDLSCALGLFSGSLWPPKTVKEQTREGRAGEAKVGVRRLADACSLWPLPKGPGRCGCPRSASTPAWDVGFMNGWVAAPESGACTQPWDRRRDECPVRLLQAGGAGAAPLGGCLFCGQHLGSELARSAPIVTVCPRARPAPSPGLLSSCVHGRVSGDLMGWCQTCLAVIFIVLLYM